MIDHGITTELIDDLKEMLIKNEGMVLHPYQCTSDKTTIGCGRNLTDNGISSAEAEMLLANDMDGVFNDLNRNIPFWQSLPPSVVMNWKLRYSFFVSVLQTMISIAKRLTGMYRLIMTKRPIVKICFI